MREIGFALRRLRGSPMFTIAAALTLAIAIGATTSLFGVVDAVLLRAFPYRDPDRVLVIWETSQERHIPQFAATAPDYLDWRTQNHAFADLAASKDAQYTVTETRDAERVTGLAVTPSYFPVLGLTPALGRPFTSGSGDQAEAAISYAYWRRWFAGAPSVIGQTLMLDGRPYTIVGVMPAGLPGGIDLWTRLSFSPSEASDRTRHYLTVFGRLKPGVSPEAGQRSVALIAQRMAVESGENWSIAVVPLLDQLLGPVRPALPILMAAAGCVLVIGAVALANLFLVRYVAREGELAVRVALGATRLRLIGELSVEAAIVGLTAGIISLGVAAGGVHVLRLLAPPTLPRLDPLGFDTHLFVFCAFISLATVFVFGTLPAVHASRSGLADALKDGRRSIGSAGPYRVQSILVMLQVAAAFALVIGAALLVEQFNHFRQMDPGFQLRGVLTARIDLSEGRYPTPERQAAFVSMVVEQLAARPGAEAVSASDGLPSGETDEDGFTVVGDPPPEKYHLPIAYVMPITPAYFHTMGIALRRGRGVLPTDDSRAVKVVVVDERLVRRYFAGRDPIGQRLSLGGPDTAEIVGIAASVKQGGFMAPDLPQFYVPIAQFPSSYADIEVRTSGELDAYTGTLKRVVASLDRTVPVSDVKTLGDRFAQPISAIRFSSVVAALFALAALALSLVGIYGVLAYVVGQRQREIGVRMALGASQTRVMGAVLRRALALTATGLALGLGAAWGLAPLLSTLLVSVPPHDPIIFIGSVIAFAVAAFLAASVPTLRAIRVNPVDVLKGQ